MNTIAGWDDNNTAASAAVPPPHTDTPQIVEEPPALAYATLDAFVNDFLATCCWVDVSTPARIWCPQWWRHDGALVRLEALWRSFEALRLDPALGISTWLRDHLDPHMAVLTDPQGPFQGCNPNKGHDSARPRVIPTEPAPAGMFMPGD
ncbi:hypothetical protein GCM10027425_33620 [Alteromonas gracilis]